MGLKLSLAAILAAGAFSFAGAASWLDEVVQGVEVGGYARYRYDSTREDKANGTKTGDEQHRFTSDADFKTSLGDNFYGVIGFRYDSVDPSGKAAFANTAKYSGADNAVNSASYFNVRQYYLGFKAGDVADIKFGRQMVGQIFTDDIVATGLKADFAFGESLGLSVYGFDVLEHDLDTSSATYGNYTTTDGATKYTDQNNLYGLTFNGNFELGGGAGLDFQVGYAMVQDVYGLAFVDVGGGFGVSDDVTLSARAQFAASSLRGEFKGATWNLVNETTKSPYTKPVSGGSATFFAVEVGAEFFGFDANAGYIGFNADKDKTSIISFDDQGSFISSGEDLLDYRLFSGKNNYYFVGAGYSFDKFRVGLQYTAGKNSVGAEGAADTDTKRSEILASVSYDVNDKLNLRAWYSHIEEKEDGATGKDKTKHFRFQAIYAF